MSPKYLQIEPGKKYKVVKLPEGKNQDSFNFLGMVGKCLWTSSVYGACLQFNAIEEVIPFDCIEEDLEITDPFLVTLIYDNPEQTLKILRGLWRMTKKSTIRNLMERGELPVSAEEKTTDEYENDWDEYLRSMGAMPSECFSNK